MIKILHEDRQSNKVYSIGNKFLFKIFRKREAAKRENMAIEILSRYKIPTSTKIFKIGRYSLYRYIDHNKKDSIDKNICTHIAKCYCYMYNESRLEESNSDIFYKNWKLYIKEIKRKFNIIECELSEEISEKEMILIKSLLFRLEKVDWDIYRKIPLHRDLHLDNILIGKKDKKTYFIDFEHFCIGPIEYEFANSLFWNDDKSISLEKMFMEFKNIGLTINEFLARNMTIFYFIEQYHNEFSQKNNIRMKILIEKLLTFLPTLNTNSTLSSCYI